MKKLSDLHVDKLIRLIDMYNDGVDAFEIIIAEYKDFVRTELGKDETLDEYVEAKDIRTILGNRIELALGRKGVQK